MTKPKATLKEAPYIPPPYEARHVAAFQALQRGEASDHQQRLVLKWLIEQASGTYQFHYYPGDRDTAFALGRAFTGQQVVKLLNLPMRRDHATDNPDEAGR